MLELLRCARALRQLAAEPVDDNATIASLGFSAHVHEVFNRRFQMINTETHSLALFLHPLCRKLAVSQTLGSRSFDEITKAALNIAKQWRWSSSQARLLMENLKEYHRSKGPFTGGQKDGLGWWQDLPVTAEKYPLKVMAIVLLSVVPHAGEVERLFSALGGTQSNRRCNLSVDTFEKLGKLRSNYSYQMYQRDRSLGKSTHRRHAHMHTRPEDGINQEIVEDLERDMAWVPPFASDEKEGDEDGIQEGDVEKAFNDLDQQLQQEGMVSSHISAHTYGSRILDGNLYDLAELDRIDKGVGPMSGEEELSIIGEATGGTWDIETLMLSQGAL